MVEGDAVISAVPCFELARLLPQPLLHEGVFFHPLTVMRPTPIISVNLWFDREITDMEFAGLRGTTIQWLFNKRKILRSGEPYISLVISGAHKYIERSKDELLALVLGELRDLFPAAREAKLVHSLVVKERFATFSPRVAAARQRLASETPVRGLHLAGDWTATGLPATIESAVKSGYTAAADVMRANRA
ncbi:MAG: FAD-dependent oxidoreductase [Terriglobia bacterium]